MVSQPAREVGCSALRKSTAEELGRLLNEVHIGGILLSGAGGTGLRTFVDEAFKSNEDRVNLAADTVQRQGQDGTAEEEKGAVQEIAIQEKNERHGFPSYHITVPLLPAYDLTESLVAVIRGVANFGVDVICRCATPDEPPNGFLGKLGGRIRNAFSKAKKEKDDGTATVLLSDEFLKGANNLLETFRIADLRVDQTLSFASERSNLKERSHETKAETSAEVELSESSPLGLLLQLAAKAGLGASLSWQQTFKDELARKSQHTLNPYTPTIATRTLDHLFSSLHDLLGGDVDKTLAVVVIHVEKCKPEVVISLLTALREVTRRHRREFPLLVTADLDFYRKWRDNVRDPKDPLRSIFDRVLLLPPLLPWEMATELKGEMRKELEGIETFLPASYLSCGIFRLAKQLYHDQAPFLFERPSPSNVADTRSPRSFTDFPYEDLKRAFVSFLQATYTDYPVREDFIGRVHFLYEIIYEVDKHWAELGRDGSFNPSVLFSGEAVRRHAERGIGEPVSRLVADFFSLVVPILTKVARDLPGERGEDLGSRPGDPVPDSDLDRIHNKLSFDGLE